MNAMQPSPALLCKLGSIIVHAEEANEFGGHVFDVMTVKHLLDDPEVAQWMDAMRKLAMLPVKRSARETNGRPRRVHPLKPVRSRKS